MRIRVFSAGTSSIFPRSTFWNVFLEAKSFATSSGISVSADFGALSIWVSKSGISSALYLASCASGGLKDETVFRSPHPVVKNVSIQRMQADKIENRFL